MSEDAALMGYFEAMGTSRQYEEPRADDRASRDG